jgi:hypothetical protein
MQECYVICQLCNGTMLILTERLDRISVRANPRRVMSGFLQAREIAQPQFSLKKNWHLIVPAYHLLRR